MRPPGGSGVAPSYMKVWLLVLSSCGGSAPNMAGPAPSMSKSSPSGGDPGGFGRCEGGTPGGGNEVSWMGMSMGCAVSGCLGPDACCLGGWANMGTRAAGRCCARGWLYMGDAFTIPEGICGGTTGGTAAAAAAAGSMALLCRDSLLLPVLRFLGCCLMAGKERVLVVGVSEGVGVGFLLGGAVTGAFSPPLVLGLQSARCSVYMQPGMERSHTEQKEMWGMPCWACRHGMRVTFAGRGAEATASSSAMSVRS